MGMTIDKAILSVKHSYMSDDDKETADFIINTMSKYQKIEGIVNSLFSNIAKEDERYALEYLGKIKEVLEDGKID